MYIVAIEISRSRAAVVCIVVAHNVGDQDVFVTAFNALATPVRDVPNVSSPSGSTDSWVSLSISRIAMVHSFPHTLANGELVG